MKKMKGLKSLKSKAGFSLVECLVAILVFTIMSLIVATILNAAITSHRSNMEETRSLKNQREALREGDVVAREAVGAFAPVQFNFEAPGVAGALPMPNVEYHFRNEVSEIDGDRVDGLEVSQIRAADSSSGGMNFPQMELASNLLGAGGVPLVDVVLSSPAANSFPWSGASGGPVRSGTDASGNGLGSTYQLAT
ncbi:MAG: prepilin-type N-terminal cleavage/methylation domain-containing protein, partial [Oscillospiraceae bacterium]|nr:prepilin-type N-terminal cleavage/methylation domain-containing protein [Oscillospiraceae bacterium]